jgi:hypothetical protein
MAVYEELLDYSFDSLTEVEFFLGETSRPTRFLPVDTHMEVECGDRKGLGGVLSKEGFTKASSSLGSDGFLQQFPLGAGSQGGSTLGFGLARKLTSGNIWSESWDFPSSFSPSISVDVLPFLASSSQDRSQSLGFGGSGLSFGSSPTASSFDEIYNPISSQLQLGLPLCGDWVHSSSSLMSIVYGVSGSQDTTKFTASLLVSSLVCGSEEAIIGAAQVTKLPT